MERLRKQTKRRFFYSVPMVIVLVGLLALSLQGIWSMYGRFVEARAAAEDAEIKLAELQQRKAFLQEKISELQTPEGVEREIRGRFNVRKEGEEVVVIVEEKKKLEPLPKTSFTGSAIIWFKELFQ